MEIRPLKPAEITEETISLSTEKVNGGLTKTITLSILAGAFIAFAAEGSNMAAFNLFAHPGTYGLGKVLAGAVFGTGLMLVILAGGELFTGNTLILAAVCEGRVSIFQMLRNWAVVYIGNFAGAVLIAYMMVHSGLLESGGNMLGAVTVKIAVYKVHLDVTEAFFLGIMCNWLVCLGVWMAIGAESVTGKIFAIFFPIWLFVTSGFEHCVANMYYIPAGIMAKTIPAFTELAGLSAETLQSLTWTRFLVANLIPVTLGNIVGGSIFVGIAYWIAYRKPVSQK